MVASPLQRLSRAEYIQSTNDLLGDNRSVGSTLPVDDQNDLSSGAASLIVTADWLGQAMQAAEDLAAQAIKSMPTLAPCPAGGVDEQCARQFIASFGKRAFRHPPTFDQVANLMTIFTLGKTNGGYPHGIELVIRAALMSPSFLYRVELGMPGSTHNGIVRLTQYEVATRLSYLLLGTTPDDGLLAIADEGGLSTTTAVRAQAVRLMADPRAKEPLIGLHQRWLGLTDLPDASKDPVKYPTFGPSLVASLQREGHDFLNDVVWNKGSTLAALLTSTTTFADSTVAALYAGKDPAATPTAAAPASLTLDPKQRSGVLTLPGIIAVHTFADESEPVHRGKFVRESLLCDTLPDPPSTVMATAPESKPGVSIRDRFAEHSQQPSCQACHKQMDPIGFGFEHYDGLGRWRDTDQGQPVNASGSITGTSDVDGTFDGIPDLAKKLLGSNQVRDCVVRMFVAMTRGAQAAADKCTIAPLRAAYDAANGDIKTVMVGMAGADSFLVRPLLTGEVAP